MTCAYDECTRDATQAGWCGAHYMQKYRGETLRPLRVRQTRGPDEQGRWRCTACSEWKSADEYAVDRTRGTPYRECNDCAAMAEVDRRRTPRRQLGIRVGLLRKYGIGPADYDTLYEAQGGRCAVCGDPVKHYLRDLDVDGRGTCVDHCHTTGRVRGILCHGCNIGLGGFKDDPVRLRAALAYLGT
jgi:hypothetical protein